MNVATYPEHLERRATEEEEIGATAPVALVYRRIAKELRNLGFASGENGNGDEPASDRMLRAPEVAERMGVAVRTVYKNADGFPFTKRFPTGSVRFSERGLLRWLGRQR